MDRTGKEGSRGVEKQEENRSKAEPSEEVRRGP